MRKLLPFCFLVTTSFGFAQSHLGKIDSSKVLKPISHFQEEYTFDKPVNLEKWSGQKSGMHVSFASTDHLYFRSEVPEVKETSTLEETVWRGERLNSVVLVWSPDTINQIRILVGDLKDSQGNILKKENIKVSLMRYVLSNFPYAATNTTCGDSPYKDAFLLPDRLEQIAPVIDRFDLPGRSVRSVWLAVEVPSDSKPGSYQGTIEVSSEKQSTTLNLKINVQRQQLPKPKDWTHRLDLWQNPWVVAWHFGLQPWSEEHKALLKKHLQLYADAGGKYITTYAVHSPWSDNSYMIEGTMIEWIKLKNGGWKFDYNIFDTYVTLAMEVGIDKAITIYTPVPWGNRFRYLDEKTGNYIYETWTPDSKDFKTFWNIFLSDLKSHLEKKGWFEKTYIGINENPMEQTLAAINVVKEHSKNWKITYAGNWHKELDILLNDYSFLYGNESNMQEVKERKARGFTTTYYVCCNPAQPNNFVFSPPIEGRWISWYTAAFGYDGFLRWAYDAWPADPSRDARHTLWPAGDCFLVYPGSNSSQRYEKLREGIVDFEKIRILRGLASKSTDANVKKLTQQLEEHLLTFTTEKEFNEIKLADAVNKGKNLIKELSDKLK